ncbi:MAG: HD domain-containing protein [Gallionellaceae bacterium]|nr:HD domain-containing protein [Gallionellaceae bacterium]
MSVYNVNLHEAIYSLSDALDLVGVTHIHHGKRVAYMAAECGKQLGWKGQDLDDLFQAAILHDSGVSTTYVHSQLAQFEWEQESDHCRIGAELLASSPLLKHLSDTVLYHHTHWSELKHLDIPLAVKMHANCIYMADRVDVLALGVQAQHQDILLGKDEIRSKILEKRGDWFNPELVDAFLEISNSDGFWFALEGEQISGYMSSWLSHSAERGMEFAELKGLVKVFSHIVDAKSPFTKQHSDGVASLARYLGGLFSLPERSCEMLELAGYLHDIGKLRVPDEILDKPGKLNLSENVSMRRHSFDTYGILKNIKGMEEISLWAAQHHERVNGSGYPYQLHEGELSLEARIIAVADVFQALAQNRPYRDSLKPEEILPILKEQVQSGKIDGEVVDCVEAHVQECWRVAMS